MVQSILRNDPLNAEIIYNKRFNTPENSSVDLHRASTVTSLTKIDDKKLEAFLKGDYLSREEEKIALETFRSMSDAELCEKTDRTFKLNSKSCNCLTCKEYRSRDLSCDIKRSNYNSYSFGYPEKKYIEESRFENSKYFKFVDCLKIAVHNLILNDVGVKKVSSGSSKEKNKVPLNQTYFLEYKIPDVLLIQGNKSKSKVDSGLDDSVIRICARNNLEEISFKNVSTHDVISFENIELDKYTIKFKISYRINKLKQANTLGFANFHFASFEATNNLSCSKALAVVLNENTPIVLGYLKVTAQLGCSKLYFGREFIDAIISNNTNSVPINSSNESLNNEKYSDTKLIVKNTNDEIDSKIKEYSVEKKATPANKDVNIQNKSIKSKNLFKQKNKEYCDNKKQSSYFTEKNKQYNFEDSKVETISNSISKQESQVLFGFLYISEAEFLTDPLNSYLTCKPFCQNETSNSRLVSLTTNPIYNFCQSIPLIVDDDLLLSFRENYTVIEFWDRSQEKDVVIGLTKIPLHPFYSAYRNPVILKYLTKNKLPVIGVDWWEPIFNVSFEESIGQVQVLIALGTEEQINTLELERGFKKHVVTSKFLSPQRKIYPKDVKETKSKITLKVPQTTKYNYSTINAKTIKFREQSTDTSDISSLAEKRSKEQATNTSILSLSENKELGKIDIGVQSDIEMDPKDNSLNNLPETLEDLFKRLAETNRNRLVENSTNTETVHNETANENLAAANTDALKQAQNSTNQEIRKTSDLLNSLQKALSLDVDNSFQNPVKKDHFKVLININGALHLPSRKKCKSKRSKCKGGKFEDSILPSTYVTFESIPSQPLHMTPIISKSTSPQWNYKCDVILPTELLFNNQKRLIFKVWRKSTNTVMTPNMQTDVVLGFAALDLTVLIAGLPNVKGWFNIVDFTGKCNGQINIHVTPLESLSNFQKQNDGCLMDSTLNVETNNYENTNHDVQEPSELLSRALKRKFTELDEITQRLRLRLSSVTNDSDTSNDEIADEFEKDINTLCIEEDFDMINFEDETEQADIQEERANNKNIFQASSLLSLSSEKKDSIETVLDAKETECDNETDTQVSGQSEENGSSNVSYDRNLLEGKQRIDTLLEKLSLLSSDTNNAFSSRYVSGCSINNESTIDTEAILNELDHNSRPNIHVQSKFNSKMFQELYSCVSSQSKTDSVGTSSSNSSSSIRANNSESRPTPIGEGNSDE